MMLKLWSQLTTSQLALSLSFARGGSALVAEKEAPFVVSGKAGAVAAEAAAGGEAGTATVEALVSGDKDQ